MTIDHTNPASEMSERDGQTLLWVFVWAELAIFAALISGFMLLSWRDPVNFAAGRAILSARIAGLQTVLLLIGGWLAASGLSRADGSFLQRLTLGGAGLAGLCFALLKLVEYRQEWSAPSMFGPGHFAEAYMLLTGYHAAHVLLLSLLLAAMAWRANRTLLKGGVTLWHTTVLVWLAIFPAVYLG